MGEEPRELFPEPVYKAMNDGYIGTCLKCVQLQQLLTESIESEVALEESGKRLAQTYVDDTRGLREQIITLEQQIERLRAEVAGLCPDCYTKQLRTDLHECRRLLQEACDHMDDTDDGWAEDWIKRAARAAGGDT
jgi:hypothetical protein